MRTILVVDDDSSLRSIVRFALEKAGFGVIEASDGAEALARIEADAPQLVVLDITMPELDGTEVCRRVRQTSSVPIVFLSSADDEIDRIIGLEIGGDDYVTKPFSPRELVARVRAVLRRFDAGAPSAPDERTRHTGPRHGALRLDVDRFRAWWDDAELTFTATEFGIVRTLLGYPGKVYSRSELMKGAYGEDVYVSDRTIDSHMRRVRAKLAAAGGDPVETVTGVGYRLRELG